MGFPGCGKTLIRGAGGGIDLFVSGAAPQNHCLDFEISYITLTKIGLLISNKYSACI